MDWIPPAVLLVAAYALAAYYIHRKKLWTDHITFYGPFMAVKTDKVGFFDAFIRFRTFLRIYGTLGVVMVVLVSVLMTVMLFYSVQHIVVQRPPLTAANEPKNVLAIPGVNDFIPFTFAVWFGLIVTMVVHESGHAVLCRVEGIRVRAMGVLLAVVPVGAYVEPDEEDQENTKGLSRMRMFGAGITNNILLGLACFALLVFLLGFAVPLSTPLVHGVYIDSPAYTAGLPPNSVIQDVNGISVTTRDDVARILNSTRPGDPVRLLVENNGQLMPYTLTVTSWPAEARPAAERVHGGLVLRRPAGKNTVRSPPWACRAGHPAGSPDLYHHGPRAVEPVQPPDHRHYGCSDVAGALPPGTGSLSSSSSGAGGSTLLSGPSTPSRSSRLTGDIS